MPNEEETLEFNLEELSKEELIQLISFCHAENLTPNQGIVKLVEKAVELFESQCRESQL